MRTEGPGWLALLCPGLVLAQESLAALFPRGVVTQTPVERNTFDGRKDTERLSTADASSVAHKQGGLERVQRWTPRN